MLNDIVDGISEKLYEAFGDEYEIYTEEAKQGLEEPCFSISCVDLSHSQVVGNRYFQHNMFSIQYFPKDTDNWKTECLAILDRLYFELEYITVTGDLLRGANMKGQLVDGVLVFIVNYDHYVKQEIDYEPMETLDVYNQAKG